MGRQKACGLLSQVCMSALTPDQAKQRFSEHIKSVLIEISSDNYNTMNWETKERQMGKQLAGQLIKTWNNVPHWKTLVAQEKIQDDYEKKDFV